MIHPGMELLIPPQCPVVLTKPSTICPRLAKLKDQQRAGLRNRCFSPSYLVDPALHALSIESPARGHSDVLLAIDFKGRRYTDYAGRRREAPELFSRARIERPEFPVGRSTGEYQVPACN